MLDIALHVAIGKSWHGLPVRQGIVIWIAAEGHRGLKKRIIAWCVHHGISPDELHGKFITLKTPVQIANTVERNEFLAAIKTHSPVLIIIDTQARCAVGLNENTDEISAFYNATGEISRATGAHVATIHHNNRNNEFRGHSSIPAAVDSHFSIERNKDLVKVVNLKQRDDEEHGELIFEKVIIPLPDTQGQKHSLVFRRVNTSFQGQGRLSEIEQKAFDALVECYGSETVTAAQWKRAASEQKGMPESSFSTARRALVTNHKAVILVEGEEGGKGSKAARYQVNASWLPTEK